MADSMYIKALEGLLDGTIDLKDGTIKVVLCTADYVANMSTNDFLDDIPAGARVATGTLANCSITGGVFDADDLTLSSVPAGSVVTQMVIYQDASPESAARLVWRIDSYTGLPVTTNGANINIAWPNDGNKIFKLANA